MDIDIKGGLIFMSQVIKADRNINILFAGEVPDIGPMIIGCVETEHYIIKRIYFRLSGNINSIMVLSNSLITANSRICKSTSHTLELAHLFHDADVPIGLWNTSAELELYNLEGMDLVNLFNKALRIEGV
jgi:hypothetical protein